MPHSVKYHDATEVTLITYTGEITLPAFIAGASQAMAVGIETAAQPAAAEDTLTVVP